MAKSYRPDYATPMLDHHARSYATPCHIISVDDLTGDVRLCGELCICRFLFPIHFPIYDPQLARCFLSKRS
jgi:hypothetical protein